MITVVGPVVNIGSRIPSGSARARYIQGGARTTRAVPGLDARLLCLSGTARHAVAYRTDNPFEFCGFTVRASGFRRIVPVHHQKFKNFITFAAPKLVYRHRDTSFQA